MFRPEVCFLQMDGITIERRARNAALVGEREIDVNHVVMQGSKFVDSFRAIST